MISRATRARPITGGPFQPREFRVYPANNYVRLRLACPKSARPLPTLCGRWQSPRPTPEAVRSEHGATLDQTPSWMAIGQVIAGAFPGQLVLRIAVQTQVGVLAVRHGG